MLEFPNLPGMGWPIKKRLLWNTKLAESVSGREARVSRWRNPRYEFEVNFAALASNAQYPGAGDRSLQNLVSFVHQCQGRTNPFVFYDQTDNYAAGAILGQGDGATLSFTAQRTIGQFAEPVGWVQNVAAVYVDGAATDAWDLVQPNQIAFTAAPAAGAVLTADFWFGYVCRLDDDAVDLAQIADNLWQGASFKFKSVRQS